DLQFGALLAGADDGGMDRAIVVLLRRRDVILKAARHERPFGMNDADRAVAILDRGYDHAEAEDIGALLETHCLALHLSPDRIGPLLAALYLGLDLLFRELLGEFALDLLDQAFARVTQSGKPAL